MSGPAVHGGAEAYGRLIAALPDAALLARADGVIEVANARAENLLGEALAGRSLLDLALPSPDAAAAFLRASARTRAFLPAALVLSGAGGQTLPLRAEGAVIEPKADGRPALLLVRFIPAANAVARFATLNLRIDELNREIGRRRFAEHALRENSELLRVTLSSIGDAVIATDRAGRVTFMNPVAESQTGWSLAEALGRPLEEVFVIVNETTRAQVENPVARVLRPNVVVGLANHTVLVRRDGREHPIDDSGAPIRGADGAVLGVVLVFRDITERRMLERERAEADRRKDEFLAMLAHELRNPLAAIGSGVEIVRRASAAHAGRADDALTEAGELMYRQVRHLARLVDDLLDASRITSGKITLRREPVALLQVIDDALAAHRPGIDARRIQLTVAFPRDPLQVLGDSERLSQIFGNLLANAVKFSRPGGRIRVSAGADAGWAHVSVADDGEGIAPEQLARIFDLFVQADTSPARARGGLGVGLTVARVIAEMHGGRIEAESAGLGQGAGFTVYLPLERSGAAPAQPEERPAAQPKRRIVVVDDNADAAASLAALLRLVGHDVRVAESGAMALRLQEEGPAEVLLLDLGMPNMDGYELARRLRRRGDAPRPLLVALTGYGREADRRRTADAGFDAHLTKPVDLRDLERLLR